MVAGEGGGGIQGVLGGLLKWRTKRQRRKAAAQAKQKQKRTTSKELVKKGPLWISDMAFVF